MIAANAFNGLIVLGFIVCLYFVPTIVAVNRHVSSVGSIVVINVFLGWTFIGWVVALAMATNAAAAATATADMGGGTWTSLTGPADAAPARADARDASSVTSAGERGQ